jgi:hypothetical protein
VGSLEQSASMAPTGVIAAIDEAAAADGGTAMIESPQTDHAVQSAPLSPAQRRVHRARIVQIVLGCIWILDAVLQFQPRMFGQGLVTGMMLPAAQGQPAPVAWSITQLAHFVRPDVGVWNFFFGAVQLCIGVGMLLRRTVKPAIVAMAVWAFGVWWFGEGFGMLLTGTASPLTGAPGAVLLYPLIGLLVWPSAAPAGDVEPGVPSSAAATGPLGAGAPLVAWSAFWALSAVLWLFPANRAGGSISSTLVSASSGQPSWYAHVETSLANALPHSGSALPWVLAMLSLAVAVGPWLSRRVLPFLAVGVALQALYWVSGMALGGMLTGMGTDPNTAPLVALLAFAMVPTLHAVPAASPGRVLVARHPVAGAATSAAALAVLVLSATYPIAAAGASASAPPASTRSAMTGMAMGGSSPSGSSHATHAQLAMPGMAGQSDPNWHYTGPPLPAQEQSVLTTVFDETEKGHAMQTPNCTAPPSGAQMEAAMQLVQTTSSAVAKYKSLSAATADGYVPITDTRYPVVHYLKLSYMQGKYVLDPDHVQSLVYAFTPYGPVLVAAMYLMPSEGDKGPMPGGCLTQWHAHTNLCTGGPAGMISGFSTDGVCPSGENPLPTPEMLHVWQVPVPGGPLTMDPTDQQVVEAAIMAQQTGQAPVTPGAQVPSLSGAFGT